MASIIFRATKDFQTYFGVKIDGKLYTSTCILMDETCAPWAVQIWLHDMPLFYAHQKQHIGDCLFLFTSCTQAHVFHDRWSKWCNRQGLMLNLKKSTTSPVQVIDHIGFKMTSRTKRRVCPPNDAKRPSTSSKNFAPRKLCSPPNSGNKPSASWAGPAAPPHASLCCSPLPSNFVKSGTLTY
ncbi:hypothetical protein BGZ74_007457 [Mortierella antarctica]|nr:hypothetical protein BGZ74_007457 [Mortierella antarctica]